MTDTTTETVVIRNQPNNCLVRFPCLFCGGSTEKQSYLFEVPDGRVVCDDCAEHPERIAQRAYEEAAELRNRAELLESEVAARTYVTEVLPVPEDIRDRTARRHSPPGCVIAWTFPPGGPRALRGSACGTADHTTTEALAPAGASGINATIYRTASRTINPGTAPAA
jgi:hypothetical protein